MKGFEEMDSRHGDILFELSYLSVKINKRVRGNEF